MVESEKIKNPETYAASASTKLLVSIADICLKRIPANPTDPRYRQGDTLGEEYKHWFRDKFGGGRFRIFFRFDSRSKVIVYAWVNDEKTLRAYGSKTDAYAVFTAMLKGGTPPDSWGTLVAACKQGTALSTLNETLGSGPN